jgi:SEC-C motif/Protein of unknown function (DUF2384)
MDKIGRNDPCHCGSGKKYKQCCLKNVVPLPKVSDRKEAVSKALQWLNKKFDERILAAGLDEGYFGGLNEEEFAIIHSLPINTYEGISINAMEWLLAEGSLTIQNQEHRVSDVLLGRGGPVFSSDQRQWIEHLATRPIRIYEVVDLGPGESFTLRDVLSPEQPVALVMEKTTSKQAQLYDLIAARLMPVDDHFRLSGAVYSLPRNHSWDLLEELKDELADLEPDSPLAREITGTIIPDYWLKLFINKPNMPKMVDHLTGEPILLVSDHYRVENWPALEQALTNTSDIEGSREEGWSRFFTAKDGQIRSSLGIELLNQPDHIKVFYRTQKYADQGKPWFEALAGNAVKFISREFSDPKGLLANPLPDQGKKQTRQMTPLTPEVLTEIIGKKIHEIYADWPDTPVPALDNKTPRTAIQTPEGLQQVIFLLHSYENGEAQMAKDQGRTPVSYDFLWRALGLNPE